MHLSSLPSDYSIGSLGKYAYRFVDFLSLSGFSYWQLLPLCVTDANASPYKSRGLYSLNPYFLDLEELYREGLLSTDTAAMGAIGYKEFLPYFRGECSLADVEAAICLGTRHYAKRQQTWFRRVADAKRIYMDTDAGHMRPMDEIFAEAMEHLAPFARAHYAQRD